MVMHAVQKRGNKHRVVVAGTSRLARNRYGKPRDGGGHSSKTKAQRQAAVLNRVTADRPTRKPKKK